MKNYLLDTHPFIWWLFKPKVLSKRVLRLLEDPKNQFFLSTINILEIQYLMEIGKIDANIADVFSYIKVTENFNILPFDEIVLIESIKQTATRDPFDRIVISTALSYNMNIITRDSWMHDNHSGIVVW